MSIQTANHFTSSDEIPVIKVKMYDPTRKARHSMEQIQYMEACYQENSKPNSKKRNEIALHLDLNVRTVQIWFQNRRAKTKSILKTQQQGISSSNIEDEEEYIPNRGNIISINDLLINENDELNYISSIQHYLNVSSSPQLYSSETF